MSSSDFLKNYELAEPTIRKLYDSKLRLAILDALKDGPLRLADLRRVVNANAPNTSSKAKDLESMGIIERMEGDYQLTPYGRSVRNKIEQSLEFYATYEKFKEFWESLDTSGIPEFLFDRISDLNDSMFVKNTETEVVKSYEYFLEFLKTIKSRFYGVTPIFHKEWVTISKLLIEKGVDAQIVATEDVIRQVVKYSTDRFKKLCDEKNVKVYLAEEGLLAAFTVTESTLSFTLREKHPPVCYMTMDLYSQSPRAIKWGLDLFDYYKKQAKPVKLSDYL